LDYKSRVGETSQTYQDVITAEQMAQFWAALPGVEATDAPPVTILAAFRQGEKELSARLEFKLDRMLHGEQDYEFLADLPVGVPFEYQSRLLSILEKRGRESRGGMLIFAIGTEYRQGGQIFATAKSTVIYRS
jgi:hypothetical protein